MLQRIAISINAILMVHRAFPKKY